MEILNQTEYHESNQLKIHNPDVHAFRLHLLSSWQYPTSKKRS